MSILQSISGLILAVALAFVFWRYVRRKQQTARALPHLLFAEVLSLLDNAEVTPGEAIGTWQVTGRYRGHFFQFKAITDTLAVRKLPSLWLMVTLQERQPVVATIDVMMRPQGATTFSHFDFLPHSLPRPADFPEDAVVKSDVADSRIATEKMTRALAFLQRNRGKELLVSPKGLRFVLQAAEADRARYGVYREANFGDVMIPAALGQEAMDELILLAERLTSP